MALARPAGLTLFLIRSPSQTAINTKVAARYTAHIRTSTVSVTTGGLKTVRRSKNSSGTKARQVNSGRGAVRLAAEHVGIIMHRDGVHGVEVEQSQEAGRRHRSPSDKKRRRHPSETVQRDIEVTVLNQTGL
jgi:hypothetical protein